MTEFATQAHPVSITAGPDGNLWFTEDSPGTDLVGRITPAGNLFETNAGITSGATLSGITTGADGNLWFTESNKEKVGRMTTSGSVTGEFDMAVTPAQPSRITAGSDGNVWYTQFADDRIGHATPAGGISATAPATAGASPLGITAGPDGALWFTERYGNRIGRVTTAGTITNQFTTGIGAGAQPLDIAMGPDGNLWFTEIALARIGRITPTGSVTEFSAGISPGAAPAGIVAGPDGNLWFTETGPDRIARITPDGSVTEFSSELISDSDPAQIAAGPDGNLWFTEASGHAIGRINTAQDPPAFRNAAPIAMPASGSSGAGGPYPSSIDVSGLEGTVTDVNIRLFGITHSFGADLEFLLVGPQGQAVVLASDAGPGNPDPRGVTLTIDDEASFSLAASPSPLISGLYRPTDLDGPDTYPAPAPAGPYSGQLSAFDGTAPNGAWQLFVNDDANGDVGTLFGGWGLDIATTGPPPVDPPPGDGGGDSKVDLTLNASNKQKLKKLAVEAGCGDESCTVEAEGTASAKPKKHGKAALKKKKFTLVPASGSAAAGEIVKLALKVKGKKSAKALARLVKKRAKAKAAVTVTATDPAGNAAEQTATIRLKR